MHKQKAVLVTGAAGFIGFHTVVKLIAEKQFVVGFDNLNDYYDVNLKLARLTELGINNPNPVLHEVYNSNNGMFSFFNGSLEEAETWQLLQENFEVTAIIHLAAQAGVRYSIEQPRKYIAANVLGFLNVLEFCRETGLKKLIYASSSSVYGLDSEQPFSENQSCDKPVSLYAATKRSNELLAHTYWHLYGIESIGLRFFTVYGPWGRPDMAPFLFTKAAFGGEPINVFNNGKQSRDFTYVDDIVLGIYQVFSKLDNVKQATVCNIGKGQPVGLMDFISAIEEASGHSLKKNYLPAQPGDVVETFADTSKLTEQFGYSPATPLSVGVSAFVKWYSTYHNIPQAAV